MSKELTYSELKRQNEIKLLQGKENLEKYSLDDLVLAYTSVEGIAAIAKGNVLNAIRKRFSSDIEFGVYLREHGIDEFSQQTRYKYMQLAKHFTNREMTNMSMTVCAEISLLMNRDRKLGNEAYQYALGRNLKKEEILEKIRELEGKAPPKRHSVSMRPRDEGVRIEEPTHVKREPELMPLVVLTPEEQVVELLRSFSLEEQMRIINNCRTIIEEKFINAV
jgi:hypothetical protein